jgi:hypothetical protein
MPSPWTRRDAAVVILALATLAIGIPVDAAGASWAQPIVSTWTWAVLGAIVALSQPGERRELAACVALATLGELFLKDVWGLYVYRLDNLPLFIPPGHALVYASARRMARIAPSWLPLAVAVTFAVVVGRGAWAGTDTFGVLWFGVFLAYLRHTADPELCTSLFLFALAIESYGTALGGWRYFTIEPWFGLTTTNPPVWIGAIYCTLETLVRRAAAVGVGSAEQRRAAASHTRLCT